MSDQQPLGVVLLVEDEPLVRLVTADILMDAHFRVIEAADAAEALRILRAEVEVDVLLSDVEMPPGMSGFALARQVHGHWPNVEIIIVSGREWPQSPSRKGLSGRGRYDSRRVLKPDLEPQCGPRPPGGSIAATACDTKPI